MIGIISQHAHSSLDYKEILINPINYNITSYDKAILIASNKEKAHNIFSK